MGDYEVNFLLNKSDTVYPFIFNELSFKILSLCSGQCTFKEIAERCSTTSKEVESLCNILGKKGLLMFETKPKELSQENSPQINFLSTFETTNLSAQRMQKRIEQSHVVVIGLGGIGTWVVKSLVLAGVRRFTLVDPDRVDGSNLNRQCLYTPEHIGSYKTFIGSEVLRGLNSKCSIVTHQRKVRNTKGIHLVLEGADLVINCADEPSTDAVNRIVTSACYPLRIPHILCGGYDGHLGFIGPTIIPPQSPCWVCYKKSIGALQRKAGYKHLIISSSDEKGGNIAPISAVVGNIHALEALKVLSGFVKANLTQHVIEVDFLRLQMHYHQFEKQNGCKLCSATPKRSKS